MTRPWRSGSTSAAPRWPPGWSTRRAWWWHRARRLTPSRDPAAVEHTIVEVVQELRTGRQIDRRSGSARPASWTPIGPACSSPRTWPGATSRCATPSPRRWTGCRWWWRTTPTPRPGRSGGSARRRARAGWSCVTLGTGIGGGIVIDGEVQRGRCGMAGEFGHMVVVPDGRRCECGNRGCLEQYASGNVLGREARELAARGLAGHRAAAGAGRRRPDASWSGR